jgi:hypothetical protein
MPNKRVIRMKCLRCEKVTQTIQCKKMCAIAGKQVINQNGVGRPIIMQTIAANKHLIQKMIAQIRVHTHT